MSKPIILPLAEADLQDGAEYIALHAPRRAWKWLEDAYVQIFQIGEMPGAYPIVDRLDTVQQVRKASHHSHSIYFMVLDEEVVILRVLHQARRLPLAEDLFQDQADSGARP
ncbi:hypothetical protein BH11ARM2_BH11ARM2_15750 [soil metagenome]